MERGHQGNRDRQRGLEVPAGLRSRHQNLDTLSLAFDLVTRRDLAH